MDRFCVLGSGWGGPFGGNGNCRPDQDHADTDGSWKKARSHFLEGADTVCAAFIGRCCSDQSDQCPCIIVAPAFEAHRSPLSIGESSHDRVKGWLRLESHARMGRRRDFTGAHLHTLGEAAESTEYAWIGFAAA